MTLRRLSTSVVLALGLALAAPAQARVPSQVNTQGVLRDAAGDLLDVPDATMVFRIYDAASGGNLLWSETQEDVPVVMGVFDALLPANPLTELPTAVQEKLALGAPLWVSIQLEGQAELPRTALVSVPYAFTANHALTAGTAADLACSGCIDASMIDGSAFTAQHLGYAPDAGDLVTATTVSGALRQLDGYIADTSADLASHKADPNAHHPADSSGIAIKPASVTVGDSKLTSGTLDLGPGANDALTAAQVTTLTAGGNADSLHSHTAQSISGLPAGGSCFVRYGSGACPQGFNESNVGVALYPYISNSTTPSGAGGVICVEGITLNQYTSGGYAGWLTGGPGASGYQSGYNAAIACATCCPAAQDAGSCRNETIYRDQTLSTYNTYYYGAGSLSSYGPLTVGFAGRGYTVSSVEIALTIGAGNSTGAVSAYDLQVLSGAVELARAPLRYARPTTGSENTGHVASWIYRADVAFTLPADNKITLKTIAVATGAAATVMTSDGCSGAGCSGTRGWASVTGCVAE